MAVRAPAACTVIFAILSQYVVQAWEEYYPVRGILNSRPNASSHESDKYCVLFYRAITKLAADEDSALYRPVFDALEWNVCEEPPPTTADLKDRFIFISSDDNCSALERASRIQSLGGAGTLIVKENTKGSLNPLSENETHYNFTLAFLHNSSYTHIMDAGDEVTVGLYSPEASPLPLSLLVIWVLAMISVSVGAFWSGKVRHKLYLSERASEPGVGGEELRDGGMPREEASMNLSPLSILGFVMLMCLMLLSLYFFFDYLVYVIIAMFCIASSVAVFSCLHPIVSRIPCGTCRTPYFNIYLVRGTLELRQILLLLFSIGVTVVWVVMRKQPWAWILQDILGIAFSINVLKLIRLPNLKICTILLSGLVVYDIFFVFITPFITSDQKSIMVEVAKGGSSQEQLPMVLKVPDFSEMEIATICQPSDNYNLLGFGDILIPGLLVAFVHSFDLQVGTPYHLYYLVNIIGYGTGLVATFIALWLLSRAQPALLYLVPFTLIPTLITALIRGEFKAMWSGDADKVGGEGGKGKGGPKGGRLPCTLALVSVVMNVGIVVSRGELLLSLCA
ncbi:signal peptide peptidase-like 2B isoform X2 [Eriocheir sinensis]|uniref:signal peptide peptidase-like 2B isoform X2 n=1 Tax=Eriocheir sinensis TaxID=95602 RepID=UPI0021CA1347|nr:signal peptide peptidase-like 2B isoform X2 [Eriocheir sinensis]